MSSRPSAGFAATLAALAAVGCQLPRTGDRPMPTGDSAADERFARAHNRWTQEKPVYSALDARIFLAVTEETWELRQARVERLALFRMETAAERDKALADEKADHEKSQRFTIGLHANERRFDDFDRRYSIWRVALVTPQGEALPARWERVSRPDANLKAVYPYLGDFWVLYRVWFARATPPPTPVTLRFASSVGRVEFAFGGE